MSMKWLRTKRLEASSPQGVKTRFLRAVRSDGQYYEAHSVTDSWDELRQRLDTLLNHAPSNSQTDFQLEGFKGMPGWIEEYVSQPNAAFQHPTFRSSPMSHSPAAQTVHILERIERILERIERRITHPIHHVPIHSFTIKEITMLPIAPGFSPVYTATPTPSASFPATPPTWTSAGTAVALTVDPTGLIATVAIPTTAAVGDTFTLTVTYTNADNTVATGSLTQTVVAAPSPDITAFTIKQTT